MLDAGYWILDTAYRPLSNLKLRTPLIILILILILILIPCSLFLVLYS